MLSVRQADTENTKWNETAIKLLNAAQYLFHKGFAFIDSLIHWSLSFVHYLNASPLNDLSNQGYIFYRLRIQFNKHIKSKKNEKRGLWPLMSSLTTALKGYVEHYFYISTLFVDLPTSQLWERPATNPTAVLCGMVQNTSSEALGGFPNRLVLWGPPPWAPLQTVRTVLVRQCLWGAQRETNKERVYKQRSSCR